MRPTPALLASALLTAAGMGAPSAALAFGSPEGAVPALLALAAVCCVPSALGAGVAAFRPVPWPIGAVLDALGNPAALLLALSLALTFVGLVLWFWVPWLGMMGGIVLMAAPEIALAGLAHLALGGPVIALARRVQAAPGA